MSDELNIKLKKNIIAIGRLLWEKELVTALNGNISARVDDESILLTGHKTCLGLLQEKDIIHMKLDGELLEEGTVSSEKLLHTEIYKNFPDVRAVIHTHTAFANAYFLENDTLVPKIFETKLYVGQVEAIDQTTPTVTDPAIIIEKLKTNNITVLRKHGVISTGKDLFECFLLIQSLEEAVKIDAISRLYRTGLTSSKAVGEKLEKGEGNSSVDELKKYKLFSKEQIDEIVRLVNGDEQLKDLGKKTKMTMDLAVKLDESGDVYSFHFEEGEIKKVGNEEGSEFLISAPEAVWKSVFNREIDPFVATTQKKMQLKGDFGKISKWYAPCNRIFELWQMVPVE